MIYIVVRGFPLMTLSSITVSTFTTAEMRLKTAKGIVSCRKLEAGDTHSKSIGEEMEVGN